MTKAMPLEWFYIKIYDKKGEKIYEGTRIIN